MVDPLLVLRQIVERALDTAFGAELGEASRGEASRGEASRGDHRIDPALHRSAHADYQADAALALARQLKKSPREVATRLLAHLSPGEVPCEVIESAEVSGPGFVNLTLRAGYLGGEVSRMLGDERLGLDLPARPETVVVDYSAPNLAKEMHVGHLRSTIIGDALVRMLELCGHRVIRQNHIGDWGTPFGMLIEQMVDQMSDEQVASDGAGASVRELSGFYRAARARFDSDPVFADRARARVVLLQSGDAATLVLWRQLIDVTLEYLAALYALLDVTLRASDVAGESLYNPELPGVVSDLLEIGVARPSEGATCVFPEGFAGRDGTPLPLIIQKGDGGYGYGTTDLAAIRYRLGTLRAQRVLYVVGAPQQQHLAMVFASARMAGWLDGGQVLEHVAFGSVLGPDKKILKTRAGEAISLRALLEEAVERARKLVDDKSPELADEERAAIARAVGIGAVKYADLSNDRVKDYVFDWNRMLSFDGNTAPYLMYAHARIRSILGKAGYHPGAAPPSEIVLVEPAERRLALELLQFPGTVLRATESMQPHRLCQHLHDLATAFMTFYERCPVVKAEEPARSSRIALCLATARVLARGLGLLGIGAPDTM